MRNKPVKYVGIINYKRSLTYWITVTRTRTYTENTERLCTEDTEMHGKFIMHCPLGHSV